MPFVNEFLFFAGSLLCLSILAGVGLHRTGAPVILVFLCVGIAFGQDGPGGIVFNDMTISYWVCSAALAVILFDGGLHTPVRHFRAVARPAFALSTLGVVLTAAVTGIGMWGLFGVSWPHAFLFGSIVASTDAAAVFLLLRQRGMALKPRIAHTLEVESGINDPMAIFLTLTFVELVLAKSGSNPWMHILGTFVLQMGVGGLLGYGGGRLLVWSMTRIKLDPGLYPILALGGAFVVFGATNLLGGSGFLAVYIAGLLLGNHLHPAKQTVQQFMDGMAWLCQIGMLLLLGLLVTPSSLIGEIPKSVILAGILIFLARPIAVFATLARDQFTWREKLFVSWVGLRGGIPIYLAIIPAMVGLEERYFNIAFIVIFCSLLLQGWTIRPVGRLLGVEERPDGGSIGSSAEKEPPRP